MTESTRVARIQPLVAPYRRTEGTALPYRFPRKPRSLGKTFEAVRQDLAAAVAAEVRPGLAVFAVQPSLGIVGRLWLWASDALRGGVVGRHDAADLALPLDETLSLRHVAFCATRVDGTVRAAAIDLSSSNGLFLPDASRAQVVEWTGACALSIGDFALFCLPTGEPLPWLEQPTGAWEALARQAPRRVVSDGAAGAGPRAGTVALTVDGETLRVAVDSNRLEAGVLVGRAERCHVVVDVDTLSRVHAVLVRLWGQLTIVDAGSTNGTFVGAHEVSAAPLEPGHRYALGQDTVLAWEAAGGPVLAGPAAAC